MANTNKRLRKLTTRVAALERELEARFRAPTPARLSDAERDDERRMLRNAAASVVGYLTTLLVASLVLVGLVAASSAIGYGRLVALGTLAGLVGSSLSALVSSYRRIAIGFEFSDGSFEPPSAGAREKFNRRLLPGFYTRPFVGAAAGLLVLAGCVSGVLWDLRADDTAGLLFSCVLAGLFAKTLIEKLKDVFQSLVGR